MGCAIYADNRRQADRIAQILEDAGYPGEVKDIGACFKIFSDAQPKTAARLLNRFKKTIIKEC